MSNIVQLINGRLRFPPLEPLPRIHTHAPQCMCPQCGKRWLECRCPMTQKLRESIPNPPHQARAWGYKGAMVLPDSHREGKP